MKCRHYGSGHRSWVSGTQYSGGDCHAVGMSCEDARRKNQCPRGRRVPEDEKHCIFCGKAGEDCEECKQYWSVDAIEARYAYWASPEGKAEIAAVEASLRADRGV